MSINFWVLLAILAIAFITGGLSVHAYPAYDWKIGAVHDWLQKRVRSAAVFFDRIKAWRTAKKSRV